jgi:hemerythrin-like domain-containing protein
MKRDPRFHGLSSDHHHALVLIWRIRHEIVDAASASALLARTRDLFQRQLRPHFEVEETVLLPALREVAGGAPLVARTLREHATIEEALAAIDARQPRAGLERFAALLHDHVRFEENELFPACERLLPGEVLDRAAQLAPKRSTARPS